MSAYLKGFKAYLLLERSLSGNSVEAYLRDAGMLLDFLADQHPDLALEAVRMKQLEGFLAHINELGLSIATQSRILSGVRAFFRYMLLESLITEDPTELLESPKAARNRRAMTSAAVLPAAFSWRLCPVHSIA